MPPHQSNIASSTIPTRYGSLSQASLECVSTAVKGPISSTSTRKSVTFNEEVRAKKTLHCNDFTVEEVSSYWYIHEEYHIMKREVKFEASLLENECFELDGVPRIHRGLECFTSAGARQRSTNKKAGVDTVMTEQELQFDEGSNDPEYIAEIYAEVAERSREQARDRAQQDYR